MKRSRSVSPSLASPQKSKKLKELEAYTTTSPFPTFPHPTSTEAYTVFHLLSEAHSPNGAKGLIRAPPSATANSAQTCGNSKNVIDALIGTILSQNTNSKNSTTAKRSLDTTFGRNNFAAVAEASRDAVVESIRMGGMANKKAATIQKVLRDIKSKHGDYSLQYLAEKGEDGSQKYSDEEVMKELVSFDGVGPKTASCVLLFCLERDSFAVDTHVFRLSKLLGWVPANANRVLAQAHLDLKVPKELKYGLHVLMIRHGRICKGCNAGKQASGECILKQYVAKSKADAKDQVDAKVDVKEENST
ncbi:hypothetical protein ONZ45_g17198 [Pleurotus djamor]|nr:hypothetical protein ONZ45_g17198 [Pleurotus djamor]